MVGLARLNQFIYRAPVRFASGINDPTSATVEVNAANQKRDKAITPKPLSEMPRPKLWPIVGSMPEASRRFGLGHLDKATQTRAKELGKIFYDQFLDFKAVFLADPKDIATMYRN